MTFPANHQFIDNEKLHRNRYCMIPCSPTSEGLRMSLNIYHVGEVW